MKKTLKDIIYNAVYQLFLIVLPLLTTPILSRRIGAEGLGVYGYVFSIAQFLITAISVGMNPFRIRSIAKARNSKEELSTQFWNIYFMQLLIGAVSIAIYLFCVFILDIKYKELYLIQLLFVLGVTLDISWFFQGIEEFAKVVIRNTLIKLSSIILIILFVTTKNDLWIYMLITSGINLLGSLVFWVGIPQRVTSPKIDKVIFKGLWKPGLLILIPQLFMQVYTTLDKTIVGFFVNPTELSYYDQSQKIARIILAVLTSITIVMLPKLSGARARGEHESIIKYTKKSFDYTLILSVVLFNIVFANTITFVPWFFGNHFTPMIGNMMIVGVLILVNPIGGVLSNQFSIAIEKDGAFALPLILGAFVSIIGNIIIVPKYGSLGATFVLIFVEIMVSFLRIFLVRKEISIRFLFDKTICKFLLYAVVINLISFYLLPTTLPMNNFLGMTVKSLLILALYIPITIYVIPELKQFIRKILSR